MKTRNLHCRKTMPALLIALVLGCFLLSPAVKADDGHGIVGLWNVHYFAGNTELFQTYDQWHSEGLEFEVNSIAPGAVCQGTWRNAPHDSVKLFHTGWNFDENGQLTGYFNETQTITVSHDRNSYDGTWDIKDYDTNGHQLDEITGTLHATRLSVNTPP